MSKAPEDPIWQQIKKQTKPLKKKTGVTVNNRAGLPEKDAAGPDAAQKPTLQSTHTQNAVPTFSRRTTDTGTANSKGKPAAAALRQDRHKRVRKGRVQVEQTLDLHGFFEQDAKNHLLDKVRNANATGLRTLLVITGKGERGEGVLRKALPRWLNQPEFAALVSGFAPAHLKHGGSGAWYVFVRKNQDSVI